MPKLFKENLPRAHHLMLPQAAPGHEEFESARGMAMERDPVKTLITWRSASQTIRKDHLFLYHSHNVVILVSLVLLFN